MKRTILLVLAALVSSPAYPQDASKREFCSGVGVLARNIMMARQAGATMSTLMGLDAGSPELQRVGEAMIIAAFRQPLYETEKMKQRTITEFENTMTLACYDSKAGSK